MCRVLCIMLLQQCRQAWWQQRSIIAYATAAVVRQQQWGSTGFMLLPCILQVAPTDIEEGMRVGVDRNKYQIQIPLPPKIDPSVTMMTVEEKPDITYSDIGGCKEQIEKMREVVELPMLHPEKFVQLGIDPPKGVLCYGPPGVLAGQHAQPGSSSRRCSRRLVTAPAVAGCGSCSAAFGCVPFVRTRSGHTGRLLSPWSANCSGHWQGTAA
jgi:hypothetical protein